MITYHQLRTFLAVSRTASITKAARELNATQPTVSLQLSALRKFLGTPLFDRSGGRFRLTPAGEMLRHYAEEALGGLRVLQQNVETLKGSFAGPLAVGAPFVMSRHVLPAVFSRFLQQFPAVDLQLHVDFPEQLFTGVLANTLDLACYVDVPAPRGITVEPIGKDELIVIASPDHALSGRRRVTAEQLNAQPFVAAGSALFREVVEAKLRDVGITPQLAAEARHQEASKRLVERNMGYSIVMRSAVADELASGRLVTLDRVGPPMHVEFVIGFRSRPVISPLVREFIRFARAELAAREHGTEQELDRPTPGIRSKRRQRISTR